jgi:predicted nucleotide-binding protein
MSSAHYSVGLSRYNFAVYASGTTSTVTITLPERKQIEAVFAVFEKHLPNSRLPIPAIIHPTVPPPTIFIGHGRSDQWKELKDHLHEKHEHKVQAYEIGARAGHTIRDILEQMLRASSFAILVMTGEDETSDGKMRARQNVIHELGLFQGRLSFSKAIVLLEDGTEEFSNLQGIHQIRYLKNNIKETFGEVLATLRREFPVTK